MADNDKAEEIAKTATLDDSQEEQENLEADKQDIADDSEQETVISLGDAPAPEDEETANTPAWVKDLRKRHKETTAKARQLEEELARIKGSQQVAEVGDKPTFENCDYDAEKFEKELTEWNARKQKADQVAQAKADEIKKSEDDFKTRQREYETGKENLKLKDFAEAEELVVSTLSVIQQGIIVKGANNSAAVIYALGKNSSELSKLAAIKDPIRFAFAVASLEGKMKVTTRKAPLPEKKPTASGGSSLQSGDKTLDRLRADAEKTGDYSKVVAHKRALRQQGK